MRIALVVLKSILQDLRSGLVILLHRKIQRLVGELDRLGRAASLVVDLSQLGQTMPVLIAAKPDCNLQRGNRGRKLPLRLEHVCQIESVLDGTGVNCNGLLQIFGRTRWISVQCQRDGEMI